MGIGRVATKSSLNNTQIMYFLKSRIKRSVLSLLFCCILNASGKLATSRTNVETLNWLVKELKETKVDLSYYQEGLSSTQDAVTKVKEELAVMKLKYKDLESKFEKIGESKHQTVKYAIARTGKAQLDEPDVATVSKNVIDSAIEKSNEYIKHFKVTTYPHLDNYKFDYKKEREAIEREYNEHWEDKDVNFESEKLRKLHKCPTHSHWETCGRACRTECFRAGKVGCFKQNCLPRCVCNHRYVQVRSDTLVCMKQRYCKTGWYKFYLSKADDLDKE